MVKPGELGNVDIITSYAMKVNIDVDLISLHDQFRCGGSQAYEEWAVRLLGLDGDAPAEWDGDGRFDLRVAETPDEMEAFLAAKQAARSGLWSPRGSARSDASTRRRVRI